MRLIPLVGTALACFATAAYGSEIERLGRGPRPPIIMITGFIKSGDGDRFAKVAGNEKFAVVTLGSPGGDLLEGLRIGQMIRSRQFATLVPNGVNSSSACAFAWLGGLRRFMQPESRIGFHAAYILQDGKAVESGVGNALVGAYLAQLGLSLSAIVYVEHAHPDEITWLTESDAREVGIDVTLLPSSSTGPALSDPLVPRTALRSVSKSILDAATSFPGVYFSHWSELGADALNFFSSVYAKTVNFYGTDVTLDVVINQKRKFMQRWPVRVYSVRPRSVVAKCHADKCEVSGVVQWDAHSLTGADRTAGSATFSFGTRMLGEEVIITSESGAVIESVGASP